MAGFLGFPLGMSETELQGVQNSHAALRSTTLTLSVGNRAAEPVDAAEVVLIPKDRCPRAEARQELSRIAEPLMQS
jgi:hypothetical protein